MALPDFTMRQLLESGAHFGHQSHRWNPKMAPYIYGSRNSIHIIDLAQTVPLLHQALKAVSDTVAKGGRVLFVGTKRQAADEIASAAKRSAQYFVNARWLGGMLTNWKTISASISRLRKLDELLTEGAKGLTKKERLMMSRERDKLETALGGIKDMGARSRPRVRHRHQQGSAGDQGSQPPQDSGDRDPRHQLRSGRHHLSGSCERRRGPRHSALLRPRRPRGDRRHLARPGRAGRRSRRGRDADRRSRCRSPPSPRLRRPTASSSWPRRAARRTIWPSSPASDRRSSRSSTSTACSITGSSPR